MTVNQLHTVLGASGAMGKAVIKELQQRGLPIRAVSRSFQMDGVEVVRADLLNPQEVWPAIEGSSHVYLCVGLPYSTAAWKRDWPLLMQYVVEACEESQAVLIFLDNIYMYGPPPLSVPFDENHPQQPVSKKGRVRKQIADFVIQAVKDDRIHAVIGRSSDFYGEGAANSMFYISFLERMLVGKAPQSLAKPGIKHTYANVLDNGRALVALALDPETYGQAWHLPVGKPVTVEEITHMFNRELGADFKASFLPGIMRKLLALFIQPLRELGEMMYQFETDYVMSYEKFHKHFPDFEVSSYEQGIREMIASFQK